MPALTLEVSESSDFGPCECCGAKSRTVWAYLHRGERTEAAYFVQWTLGQVDRHGATTIEAVRDGTAYLVDERQ